MADAATLFVGMDVHKTHINVAALSTWAARPEAWTTQTDDASIRGLVKRLRSMHQGPIKVCYEAGPCGYFLMRRIEEMGPECHVIAPSLIPVQTGVRVKTDRRDASKLAFLLRAGLLTDVRAPTPEAEAARDLCRSRYSATNDLGRSRARLLKFLMRNGHVYRDGRHWTKRHRHWLSKQAFSDSNLQFTFEEYLQEVRHHESRRDRIDQRIQLVAEGPEYSDPVAWLRCLKGIDTLTALSILVELHDLRRFPKASHLFSYVGLTPSEYSSGRVERRGGITKAGNTHVRRLLIESAWHYRHQAAIRGRLKARRQGQPAWVIEIADQAHRRLHSRFRHLVANGKSTPKAAVAVARELLGFVWSIVVQAPVVQASGRE